MFTQLFQQILNIIYLLKNVRIRIVQLGECSHIMHLCSVTSMKQNITSTAYYFNSRAFMLSKVYSSVDIRRKNKWITLVERFMFFSLTQLVNDILWVGDGEGGQIYEADKEVSRVQL